MRRKGERRGGLEGLVRIIRDNLGISPIETTCTDGEGHSCVVLGIFQSLRYELHRMEKRPTPPEQHFAAQRR